MPSLHSSLLLFLTFTVLASNAMDNAENQPSSTSPVVATSLDGLKSAEAKIDIHNTTVHLAKKSTTPPVTKSTTPSPVTTPKPKDPTPSTFSFHNSHNNKSKICVVVTMIDYIEIVQTKTTKFYLTNTTAKVNETKSVCGNDTNLLVIEGKEDKISYTMKMSFTKQKSGYELSAINFDVVNGSETTHTVNNKTSDTINAKNGNNFMCNADQAYAFNDGVKMTFSHMQVQAFRDQKMTDTTFYGHVEQCRADNKSGNIVPIAVGAALAGLVLIVLVAYIIGRKRNRSGYESV